MTVTNSIIQNNDSSARRKRRCRRRRRNLPLSVTSAVIMSNSQVLRQPHDIREALRPDQGDRRWHPGFCQRRDTHPQSHFTNATISGNTAAGIGGGMKRARPLKIDRRNRDQQQHRGSETANAGGGGDRQQFVGRSHAEQRTMSSATATGDGGGLYTGNGSAFPRGPDDHHLRPLAEQRNARARQRQTFSTLPQPPHLTWRRDNWWGTMRPQRRYHQ